MITYTYNGKQYELRGIIVIITCISASNTKLIKEKSTSTKVCYLIKDMVLKEYEDNVSVNVISLMDYDIKPCILCGGCSETDNCIYDKEFNKIYSELLKSDGIFFVVPHYSPIPSKLIMVFEKINEILYASWIKDSECKSPLSNKAVGIIGHGGMGENEKVLRYYHDNLITPVANTLESLSFNIIGVNDSFPKGVAFGLKDNSCLKKVDNSIFPEIIQDWITIEDRIRPLIENVIEKVHSDGILT